MSTPNRAALLTKIHKVLKKHYTPVVPRSDQPVLESLLFACCLENTHYQTAEQVYTSIKSSFFDWNEVRVSSVKELAEVMERLADSTEAATHLKGILQSVFESDYSFDLEPLKKQNLGQAVKRLQQLDGATPFVVAYATQTALGGHAIPLDRGALGALVVVGAINETEAKASNVPGLERAIPKSKGQEFGSLLHEWGADFVANPFSPALRDLFLSISPDAKERLPKRGVKKPVVEEQPAKKKGAEKPAAGKKKEKEPAGSKRSGEVRPAASAKGKAAGKKTATAKPLAKRKPR